MMTASGKYATFHKDGLWYFYPEDRGWLTFNANDSYSEGFATEAEALAQAEAWEKQQEWEEAVANENR